MNHRPLPRSIALAVLALFALACTPPAESPPSRDAGRPLDAGGTVPRDAGHSDDAGIQNDAGPLDAGPLDAGLLDAGSNDAGPLDAGLLDAGFAAVDAGDPNAPVTTQVPHWALAFVDDFKGKTGRSDDAYCFDELKPQCVTWPGGTLDCDHVGVSGNGFTPPLKENFASVLRLFDGSRDYAAMPVDAVKSAYGTLITDRLRHLNKCTWSVYMGLNWMATDYQGNYSARFDATQVTVDPSGQGHLKLLATAAPVAFSCPYGGTNFGVSPNCQLLAFAANEVRSDIDYTVDPNPAWPGIYYPPAANGQCPAGGTFTGVNCQLRSFPPHFLEETGVHYKVDADARWPGVYYANDPYRCRSNIDYAPALAFRNLTCPVVNGGIMSMHADTHPYVDPAGASHRRGHTQYRGRFEAKVRLPKGVGAFPAAWLMPVEGGWPYDGGEIDVVEARDAANETYHTFHTGKCFHPATFARIAATDDADCVRKGGRSTHLAKGFTTRERAATEFWKRDHVFAVEWVDQRFDFFLNNVRVGTIATGMPGTVDAGVPASLAAFEPVNFPFRAFYWILNHSTWVAPDKRAGFQPQTYSIDWVRNFTACGVNRDFCPCGGTFAENVGCRVPPGFQLQCPAGVAAPAVSNGGYAGACSPARLQCVNGGSRSGQRCLVKAFAPGELHVGTAYWVDADPRWPGLYYAPVNGGCPYGGSGSVNCQVASYPAALLETGVGYVVEPGGSAPGVYYVPDFP